MARPVTLFTGQWADLPLEDMCRKASDFGYDGIELACWGDHFEVNKAVADPSYCSREARPARPVRPAVPCDQHAPGRPGGVRSDRRAAQGDPAAARVGRRRSGRRQSPGGRGHEEHRPGRAEARRRAWSTASPARAFGRCSIRSRRCPTMIDEGFKQFAERWNPILDVFGECGVRFALEVHPTEIAFDIVHGPAGARGARQPRGVRLQLRSQPPALAGRRSGRVHSRVPGPHLPRATSRTRSSRSTAAAAFSPATSTSATRAAAGTSARRAAAA